MTGSNLEDAQSVVFAVGTGTGTAARRTGFLIDSGSNVIISGSLNVTGSARITTLMNLAAQNPLPSGLLGDLAVSSSNNLYFNNGSSWVLVV
jgi:hypothetical protein